MPRKVTRILRTINVYFAVFRGFKAENQFLNVFLPRQHVGNQFSFCQNEKEEIRITRGTTDVMVVMDRKPILKGLKKNKRENPSSSPWLDIDSNLNPS